MLELPTESPCPFCEYLNGLEPCVFVSRGEHVSVIMNRAQYERGAVLLIPNRHVETLLDLDEPLMGALYPTAKRTAAAMVRAFGATGLNMFQNNGVKAGQSVAHFHVHLIPRYATSEPWRRFREADFPHTPLQELEAVAAEIRTYV